MTIRNILCGLVLLILGTTASATQVSYTLTALGGNLWQYRFTITNDGDLGAGVAVRWFSLAFDPSIYDEPTLSITSLPVIKAHWDEKILPSGPGFPANYDVLALDSGIPTGNSISGFTVQVGWRGVGTPGDVPFEVIDTTTLAAIGHGTAVNTAGVGGVSIPTLNTWMVVLLMLVVGGVSMWSMRRSHGV
jgi:hypothetical protein